MSVRPWGSSSVPLVVLLDFFALPLRRDGGGGGADFRDFPERAPLRVEFAGLGDRVALVALPTALLGDFTVPAGSLPRELAVAPS
jgi:hypothetical protein